jgi:hypothetical protein
MGDHETPTVDPRDAGGAQPARPRVSGRRGIQPEMLVGIGALLVSVCALGVGVYEASLERHHARAEVWPHVEISLTVSTNEGFRIDVLNNGLGPAVIKAVDISLDGVPASGWPQIFDRVLGRRPDSYFVSTLSNRVLRAGDQITMLNVPARMLPPDLTARLPHIGTAICYASVFDEHWQLATPKFMGDSTWREVSACPPPAASGAAVW